MIHMVSPYSIRQLQEYCKKLDELTNVLDNELTILYKSGEKTFESKKGYNLALAFEEIVNLLPEPFNFQKNMDISILEEYRGVCQNILSWNRGLQDTVQIDRYFTRDTNNILRKINERILENINFVDQLKNQIQIENLKELAQIQNDSIKTMLIQSKEASKAASILGFASISIALIVLTVNVLQFIQTNPNLVLFGIVVIFAVVIIVMLTYKAIFSK